jgi:selenium-binding protein 1
MVVWDLHTRQPKKVLDVPGAPLEDPLRLGITQQLLLHHHRAHLEDLADLRWTTAGEWQAKDVATSAMRARFRCRWTSPSRQRRRRCCG